MTNEIERIYELIELIGYEVVVEELVCELSTDTLNSIAERIAELYDIDEE